MELHDIDLCKVRIISDGITSKLEVDGTDMSKAMSITYCHTAGSVPTLTVVLPVDGISIDSPARMTKIDGHTVAPVKPSKRAMGTELI